MEPGLVGGVSSHEEALNTRPAVDRNPGWSVETLLVGLQSFMLSEESAADRPTPGVSRCISAYLGVYRLIGVGSHRLAQGDRGREGAVGGAVGGFQCAQSALATAVRERGRGRRGGGSNAFSL